MNTAQFLALFALAIMLFLLWKKHAGQSLPTSINIGEGFFPGSRTYKLDAALTARHLLVKAGSDAQSVTLAGAADIPIGVATDEGAIGDYVAVDFFGSAKSTKLGIASGAIANGAFIVADANGKVRTLPGSAGTYYIIGRALNATTTDGDPIQFDPIPAVQRVV